MDTTGDQPGLSQWGKDIEWYFHEQAAAHYAEQLFSNFDDLRGSGFMLCLIRGHSNRIRESNECNTHIDNSNNFAEYHIHASWVRALKRPI